FSIEFSNVLDPNAFDADQIRVEPAIAGLRIDVYGPVVSISGATVGRTDYTVTLDADLRDEFGQTLGTDRTVTFEIGTAPPQFRGLDQLWVTTDPAADAATVTVSTINHDAIAARAWAVDPSDLEDFRRYLDRWYSDSGASVPSSWPLVFDETIDVVGEPDRWVETAVDLTGEFDRTGSQLVVEVRPTLGPNPGDDDFWRNRPTIAWVQRTTLGIDAVADGRQLVIRTTDLTTGEPLGRVPVELIGDGRVATTDAEGLAEIELGPTAVDGLWARSDDQTAFLVDDWWCAWSAQERTDEARWYVFDDRGVYRPGETARLTGWVRNFTWSTDLQLELWDGARTVRYSAWDAQGVELAAGTAELGPLGRFVIAVDVPPGANLGQAYVELFLDGVPGYTYGSHQFQIQEFRRPEFEVTARPESPAPYYLADPMTVAVDAEYFAGGALPDAAVDWSVRSSSTTYAPPNWNDFVFGEWRPWWLEGGWYGGAVDVAEPFDSCWDCGPFDDATVETYQGRTDVTGTHYLRIDLDGPDVDLPTSVIAEATVFDVDRQAWASRVDLVVHAARSYVGLRTDRSFVEVGTPLRIDAVVTDVDGAITPGRAVQVSAGRLEWAIRAGDWTEDVVDEQTCRITSTDDVTDGSMRCEFPTEIGGEYRITAVVTDADGRTNRTELTQWVSGDGTPPTRTIDQGLVTIVPDAESYRPGDVAELLVVAPFAPAYGAVTVARGEIVSTFGFEAEDGSAVVELPIESPWVPGVTVQVDVTGVAERSDDDGTPRPDLPPRPAYASGTVSLDIPPFDRTLTVTATPADAALAPGDDTSVTVTVIDADGSPVAGADVALVVVDEAVLSVTGYELLDPLAVFYRDLWADLRTRYARSSIVLARSDLLLDGGDDSAGSETEMVASSDQAAEEPAEESAEESAIAEPNSAEPIDVRADFEPLAVYAPTETTGSDGSVTVAVPLPDTLTRYRVMAVAVDGVDRFGSGESTITARLPLTVRPSAPRFANFGDEFEFPVVLQNQTDAALEVDLVVQTSNLGLTGPAGRRVTVPANDRIEVRFPATADEVGTARFRLAAVSATFADATSGSLPVYTPATAEAFATYGVVDDGVIGQPFVAPTGVLPQFGGLEIGTSSTALQALTDAVLYLVDHDYGSTDGYASRIMAVAALRDVLDAFDADGLPDRARLDVRVATDVERLAALQNDDGGWPWFQRGRRSIAFLTVQATHALVLARDAGYQVSTSTLDLALDRLATIEALYEPTDSRQVRDTTTAYALHVRDLAGEPDRVAAEALFERAGGDLDLDALAWLWPSIDDPDARTEIARRIRTAAVETASAAVFATDFAEDSWVIAQSDRRTDGIVLDALVTEEPDSDLIPKVVAGLLGNQVRGRWNNTYENAFILLALHRYFVTFEGTTPDFVARAWLGDLYLAESEFAGRSLDRASTLVPMDRLVESGPSTIVLSKEGDGRLYYRLGLRYAPADLALDPRDEGFVVDRVYEAVDDPGDVVRAADGSWRIRAGATVRVRLTMVADAQRTGVALIDPLPAGLEPVNPALAISPSEPTGDAGDGWWGWYWFEHQNLRDDRAEAFASYLSGGTYEYSYVTRATTPGTFVAPPARAEEMYAPEVFGRSGSDRVVIG
ncbi:MAG: hypothetical protein RLZZ01_2657, partial [Actinomycetota bacterium]